MLLNGPEIVKEVTPLETHVVGGNGHQSDTERAVAVTAATQKASGTPGRICCAG